MTLGFQMKITWSDKRLVYTRLWNDSKKNILTKKETESIWMPTLEFSNTKEKFEANFKNQSITLVHYIKGQRDKRQKRSLQDLHFGYKYSGNSSFLTSDKHFSVDFECKFQDMPSYPFDSQECTALIQPNEKDLNFVKLIQGNLTYIGTKDLSQYILDKITFHQTQKGIELKIWMTRELVRETLTTILPTFLIIMVSFTTSFYGNNHFDAIVGVNVTAFLVIATLFISVSSSLPRTSSMKMIDIWMIVAMFVPLFVVVLQTMLNGNDEKRITPNQPWKKELTSKKQKVLQTISLYVLPGVFLLFAIVFYSVGLLYF